MEKAKLKMEMVPSEKGWAYVICVGFTLIVTCSMAIGNSIGLIFSDFIKEHGGAPSALSSIHGLTGIVIAFSGLLVPHAKNRYSLRQIALFAAVCLTLSWFLSIFITKIWHMSITFSFFHGVGWGIFILVTNMMFNSYFVKKRVMFMSICMSVVGVSSIFAPYMIEYFLREYGYKGTAALLAAITLHSIVGSTLFQPVEWHLVPKIIDDTQEQEGSKILYAGESMQNDKNRIELQDQKNPLMKTYTDDNLGIQNSAVVNVDIKPCGINETKMDSNKLKKLERILEADEKTTIWSKINKCVDFSLYKKFSFVNVNLAITFGIYTDIHFYALLPLLLLEYGFTKIEVATCISITSIADLVSKMLLILVGKFFRVNSIHLCYYSCIGTTIIRFIFLQFDDFLGVAIMTGLLGFFRAWFFVAKPLMCAEILPIERYASAFGLTMVTTGLLNGSISPLIGWIRDFTGNFELPFYFITVLGIIPIVSCTFELFILKKMKKKVKVSH